MFVYNFLLTLHLIITITLILVILIQTGKGAEIGAVFGGGGAVFGSTGAATFLHKLTIGLAAVFMATSLVLAIIAPKSQATIFKPVAETHAPVAAPSDEAIPPLTGEAAPQEAEAATPSPVEAPPASPAETTTPPPETTSP